MRVGSPERMTRIAGIWDLRRSGGSLGTLLILLEELQIQRRIHDADAIHMVIVPDAAELVGGMSSVLADGTGDALGGSDFEKLGLMAEVSRAMSGVADCHVCIGQAAIQNVKNLMRIGCVPWPDPELLVRGKHCYDSTRMVQDFYSHAGNIPRLSCARIWWRGERLYEEAGDISRMRIENPEPCVYCRSSACLARATRVGPRDTAYPHQILDVLDGCLPNAYMAVGHTGHCAGDFGHKA